MKKYALFLLALGIGACSEDPTSQTLDPTEPYGEFLPVAHMEMRMIHVNYDTAIHPTDALQFRFLNQNGEPAQYSHMLLEVKDFQSGQGLHRGYMDDSGWYRPKIQFRNSLDLVLHSTTKGLEFQQRINIAELNIPEHPRTPLIEVIIVLGDPVPSTHPAGTPAPQPPVEVYETELGSGSPNPQDRLQIQDEYNMIFVDYEVPAGFDPAKWLTIRFLDGDGNPTQYKGIDLNVVPVGTDIPLASGQINDEGFFIPAMKFDPTLNFTLEDPSGNLPVECAYNLKTLPFLDIDQVPQVIILVQLPK